jgi:DUF1009 family protein
MSATEITTGKIGLVAGWGDFPVRVAKALTRQGYEVHCAAIRDHADPVLAEICHSYQEFGYGRMGAQVRFLQRAGVREATLAGKIFKTLIFRKFHLLKHFPDLMCWRYFYPILLTKSKDRRDDTLLTMVTELYADGGITFSPATDFAPELLVKQGTLTRRAPSSTQLKDIRFGWMMAKELGRLDIGQTVVIKDQAVMAVEAIEGTDECIRRAGQLCQSGGLVVVKVAKPKQDMRFDVPTIGVGTIETIHKAGGRVLAIEADKTIVLDETKTIRAAEEFGISIVAYRHSDLQTELAATKWAG